MSEKLLTFFLLESLNDGMLPDTLPRAAGIKLSAKSLCSTAQNRS